MHFRDMLLESQVKNDSFLCVGLDPEPSRFPAPWTNRPGSIIDFCSMVVEATRDLVLAFKPQIAHFAAQRAETQLERLIAHIHEIAPGVPVILDAKRGDIGSTAEQYAREAFERYGADAVTLSPYLGFDSIEPYTKYKGKGLFLLCRTTNPGGSELQSLKLEGGELLYERIARLADTQWNASGQLGLVIGAQHPNELVRIREIAPTLPLLIPGIGAQGGSEKDAMRGHTPQGPVSVNSSRAIIYAPPMNNETSADAVRRAAREAETKLNHAKRALAASS